MEATVTMTLQQYDALKKKANVMSDNNIMNFISKEYVGEEGIRGNRYNVIVDTDKLNKHIMSFSSRCEEIKYTNGWPDIDRITDEIVKLAKLKQECEEMRG